MNHRSLSHHLLRPWLTGLCGSWICVWIAGPWILNSILVRCYDSDLDSILFCEGDVIRWRSEGWGTTRVGPHGLPGWMPNGASERVVIWGDSQVEGLCVDDANKINNQMILVTQEETSRSIDCIPIGRSGSDAAHWNRMISNADQLWHPIVHVWVIAELSDLLAIVDPEAADDVVDRWQSESSAPIRWAKQLHAEAAFQAARNGLLDRESGGLRSLRFSPGPVQQPELAARHPTGTPNNDRKLRSVGSRLSETNRSIGNRLLVVYAPAVPRIVGRMVLDHPDDDDWNQLQAILSTNAIATIDLRPAFIDHWRLDAKFARGFHNGTPGFGHLNEAGNRLIASAISEHLFSQHQSSSAAAP